MGKGRRVRADRGVGGHRRNSTVSPGIETVDGAREHGPLLAGYFHVQAVSGMVVLQVGTREFRRLILLTAADAIGVAKAMRDAAPVAIEQYQYPQLVRMGFPNPHLGATGTENEFFARVNAWAQELRWIEPDAELSDDLAGVGIANAHVVFVQPMPHEPGRYTVTFFQPHDVARLAAKLETSGAEAAGLGVGVPEPHEILENARSVPWPPGG